MWIFMMGIYCFKDLKNNDEIVYIGKDSNIGKNKRYYAHIAPSKYDAQPINRIVQNNPNRYKYEILKKLKRDDYHPNLLSALEMIYIRRHRPKFNYTPGGDGANFGKYHREWKDYARIVKRNITNNKQKYCIKFEGKVIKQSFYPIKLIDWFEDEYPDEKLVYDEELISDEKSKLYEEEARKNRSESHKGEKSHLWGTSIIEEFGGIDFLKSRAKEGKTQEEVAVEIGKDRMAIRSYLKTRGTSWGELKENKSIGSIMDDWGGVDYMKDEIKKGRSMEDVANDIGLSSQSLRKYLKKRDTSWTELTKNVLIVRNGSIVDEYGGIPFIKQCIREGKSQQEIADEIGRDRTLIQKYLKSRGTSWKELKKET